VNAKEEFVAYSTIGTTGRIHHRHASVLAAICPQLEAFMFKIHKQGIQLTNMIVPAGCTYLCQPVDVGVNKPIKTRLNKMWEDCIRGSTTHNGQKCFSPIITELSGLVDIGLIRMYTKFEGEKLNRS
jgi:hypothetical protein